MRRLTPRPARETTRKPRPALLTAVALALSGCATPGPLHVYTVAPGPGAAPIRDFSPGAAAEVPSYLEAGDELLGFAYDPFTDHFFLRLAPGNRIRVVDRPARAIKREFEVARLGPGGDLAIRPRDGHVFFLEADSARIVETSRLGKVIRTFEAAGVAAASALAYDSVQDELLVLHADGRRISRHAVDGRQLGTLTLEQPVGPALAFDSERRELFAPLPAACGVFDLAGKRVRHIDAPTARFVDVGPRSFVRVF